MPFGQGTTFWILKSHDVDCFAGSEFASSYNTSSQIEYPVTLRSPLFHKPFAYCATYDPNPRGSGMTLGAAPCGTISCAPLPLPQDGGAKLLPSLSRNPDGTLAPKFFTTRPCNYLDPNCHVSQIFLYSAKTGAIRPMYHTGQMQGVNRTWISSGQPRCRNGPEPLVGSVQMVFRQGDTPPLPGWPDPDPALVLRDPAFDGRNGLRISGPNVTVDVGEPQASDIDPNGSRSSLCSTQTVDSTFCVVNLSTSVSSTVALDMQGTLVSSAYPVWLTPVH
ncbi:hypothetical protein RhiJN_17887 [Ceratobasidium sp. AG-Ba]|nr:hypothetical protein RhiJN_17887 [Ceratobasidium sp. AG-Ba]